MLFFLANIVVLTLAALASWWLSGYDAKLTGENERRDFIRRAIRVGTTLVLVELAFLSLWRFWRYGDQASGMAYLIIALPLALALGRLPRRMVLPVFHGLIDPEDRREFDPAKSRRDLDMLASLVQRWPEGGGHSIVPNAQGIRRCQRSTLDTTVGTPRRQTGQRSESPRH